MAVQAADQYDGSPNLGDGQFDYAKLTRFVDRILLERETLKTSLRATAFLDGLRDMATVKNGQRFELPVRRELSGTTKTFTPYDDLTDFVGDSPYVGAASGTGTANTAVNTYTQKDPIRNMEVRWAFIHDNIRFSNIFLTWQDSERKFLDYFVENIDYVGDSLKVFMANQLLFGTGTGSGEGDMYGIYNQVASYSGTKGVGLTVNNDPSNTHFGLPRHLFPNMVGNIWRSDIVHSPNGNGIGGTPGTDEIRYVDATGAIVIAATAGYDFAASSLSNCGTRITLSAGIPAGFDVDDLYADVTINDALNAPTLDGQTFRVIIGAGAATDTIIELSQIINDPASAAATAINVDVQIRPKYNFDIEGEAGTFTVDKVHKAYTSDGALDGNDHIDYISVGANRFYSFLTSLQQLQRWGYHGEDMNLLSKGFPNFTFNAAHVVVDNYELGDNVRLDNTRHCHLYFLDGYDRFRITGQGLHPDTSGRRIDSVVGDVVVGAQVVERSPNRAARITGLTS